MSYFTAINSSEMEQLQTVAYQRTPLKSATEPQREISIVVSGPQEAECLSRFNLLTVQTISESICW